MAGFGFLRHMIDAIKYNRDLLGRKKSLRELTGESKFRYRDEGNPDQLDLVVKLRKARRKKERIRARWIAIAVALFFIAFWYFITRKYYSPHFGKKETHYTINVRQISDNEMIRTHYYMLGGKALDMRYRNGLRHRNSESYYETGEQFRSALYYNDTLVTEVFFNTDRDTIFLVKETEGVPYSRMEFSDPANNALLRLEYREGLIRPGSLRILNGSN